MNFNEQYVLGSMIRHYQPNNGKFIKGFSLLKAEMFSSNDAMNIFMAIKACLESDIEPDIASVSFRLNNLPTEGYVSWQSGLMDLFKNTPSSSNFVSACGIVKSEYDAKMALELFEQAKMAILDVNVPDPRQRIKNALATVSDVDIEVDEQQSSFEMTELLAELCDEMERNNQSGGGLLGLSTGFEHLDNQIQGLQNGETYVIAGSPGSGKTTLAINFMINAVMDQKRVLFYSLEMPRQQIASKVMSYKSGVSTSIIRSGDLEGYNGNQAKFDAAFTQMIGAKFVVDEGLNLTAENLDLTTKRNEMKLGGVDLICIDYLTLMDAQGESETVKASNAAKACKRLAKKYNCPVIILAQLVKNTIGRPKKSDLKQTGQIEQDACSIILLYKDPDLVTNTIEAEIAKNRWGSTGMTYFDAQFSINKFEQKQEMPQQYVEKKSEKTKPKMELN